MQVIQAFFTDPQAAWQDALLIPIREEAQGPVVDLLQVRLNEDGSLSDFSRRLKNFQAFPWGWENLKEDTVLFVERPLDCMALWLSGVSHAVCVPPELNPSLARGGDFSSLTLIEERLKLINRVELTFQDNDAGHSLEEELSRRLGRDRCFRLRWQSHAVGPGQLPSAYSVYSQYGPDGLKEALVGLSPYPVAGIHELMDVNEEYEMYFEFGFQPGPKVGLPSVDLLYSVPEGQVTFILGIPGHGKSTLAEDFLLRLSRRYGWAHGIFSPENQPIARYFATLTEKLVGKPFMSNLSQADDDGMSRDEKNQAKRFLQDHIKLILPDDERGTWSLDSVLERARTLVFRYGIKTVLLDPWNELDHSRPPHMTHEDYLSTQLSKVSRFARACGVHVFIVSHPVKMEHKADNRYPVPTPYMAAGGAMWFNKCDFILVPYRHRNDNDEEIVDLYCQKVRQREHGKVGLAHLRYDVRVNQYIDDVDIDKRRQSNQKKVADFTQDQLLPRPRPDTPVLITRAKDPLLASGQRRI